VTGDSVGSLVVRVMFLHVTLAKLLKLFQTWGGGTDSYLEYLLKYPRSENINDNTFVNAWLTAVDSSIQTLARVNTTSSFA